MEKILVLAGGFDHIRLIKELKNRGKYIILADYYKNPPAKKYADVHYQISTLDEEKIYDLALKEKVAMVVTACTDQALLTVARVSERLHLPTYISAKAAMNVTNKAFMKKCFMDNQIMTAEAIFLENIDTWKEKIIDINKFPVVVKPCDCNSSKGVIKVQDTNELKKAIERAFELSRSKKVIVEEYIEGKEISIDVWMDSKKANILSVTETDKIPNDNGAFTICRSKYPVINIENYKKQIMDTANNIAKAFQLYDCPLLIQALLKDEKLYVIEFSARMGGGTKYELIEAISGVDIMKVYVNRILGERNQTIIFNESMKRIELEYLYGKNGIVKELIGFNECKEKGLIKEYFQYKTLGNQIDGQSTSSDRIAGILLIADDAEEMIKIKSKVIDQIDVLDENKNSILYKDSLAMK